ncbi:MAG: NAD-dependent epimerase/dehydratase family protein [Actinomycetota bacterium]
MKHLVVGAGPVGRTLATLLAARGDDVVLASRSGAGPAIDGVRRLAVDAADPVALTAAADGADAIHNCVNPPDYAKWPELWPPISRALLTAAERSGAVLATVSNLYAYGQVDAPMVEGMPDAPAESKGRVRAEMWAEAKAAHEAGRVRAVEVRASDYMGDGVGDGSHVCRVAPRALAGKPVKVIGSAHQPHTWTDVLDVARAMDVVSREERAWGRVWHAPSNPPRTQAEAVADVCAAVGRPAVKVSAYPGWALGALGMVSPMMRELKAVDYQFTRPFMMDSGAITREFGLEPTPWAQVCERTARSALED